jgi:hypothetical protein
VVAEGAALPGWHEPCERRLSRTVLRAPRGANPRGDSAAAGNRCPYRDRGPTASAIAPRLSRSITRRSIARQARIDNLIDQVWAHSRHAGKNRLQVIAGTGKG